MTEVPEYLLERSRARRAALGLGGDDSGGAAPAPAAPSGEAPASAAPAVAETAAPAEGAAVAVPAEVAPPTEALPTYIADPGPKSGIPVWMMPVLLLLPLWAIVYIGAFGEGGGSGAQTPLELGQEIYSGKCASCHGATGGGGVGPALAGGEAKITFPDEAAHIEWVENGSQARKGQPYGDPARAGGPRTAKTGGMPGFKSQLTPEEIQAVVTFERDGL